MTRVNVGGLWPGFRSATSVNWSHKMFKFSMKRICIFWHILYSRELAKKQNTWTNSHHNKNWTGVIEKVYISRPWELLSTPRTSFVWSVCPSYSILLTTGDAISIYLLHLETLKQRECLECSGNTFYTQPLSYLNLVRGDSSNMCYDFHEGHCIYLQRVVYTTLIQRRRRES